MIYLFFLSMPKMLISYLAGLYLNRWIFCEKILSSFVIIRSRFKSLTHSFMTEILSFLIHGPLFESASPLLMTGILSSVIQQVNAWVSRSLTRWSGEERISVTSKCVNQWVSQSWPRYWPLSRLGGQCLIFFVHVWNFLFTHLWYQLRQRAQ